MASTVVAFVEWFVTCLKVSKPVVMKKSDAEKDSVPPRSGVVVIIPFYNGSTFIRRSLASVYAQTLAADEVVVVNDGSLAPERELLGQVALDYPELVIIDQDNGGQGAARNTGVSASTSPYICFLDQDDFYLPDHIAQLVSAVPRDEASFGVVYADLAEAEGDGQRVRSAVVKELGHHPKESLIQMLRHDMFVLPSASLISRVAFDAVGGFDVQFMGYEDDDIFLRMFRKGFSNHFLDRPVTVWCIHTDSTSFSIRMSRSRFLYFKKLVRDFPDQPRQGRFYLRDCLIPRFGRFFIDEVIEAKKAGTPTYEEMAAMLAEYKGIVLANPGVGRRYKWMLRIVVFMLKHSHRSVVRGAGALTRLPGTRRMRRLMG